MVGHEKVHPKMDPGNMAERQPSTSAPTIQVTDYSGPHRPSSAPSPIPGVFSSGARSQLSTGRPVSSGRPSSTSGRAPAPVPGPSSRAQKASTRVMRSPASYRWPPLDPGGMNGVVPAKFAAIVHEPSEDFPFLGSTVGIGGSYSVMPRSTSAVKGSASRPRDYGKGKNRLKPPEPHIRAKGYLLNLKMYIDGSKWTWLKNKTGAQVLSSHLLIVFVCFLYFECRSFILAGSIGLIIPVTVFLFGIVAWILMCIILFKEPGAMPILEHDLQELEVRYYNFAAKEIEDGEDTVLKNLNYGGKPTYGDFCFTCRHFKDLRTVHCTVCGHCIGRFDHHCRILGGCIGIRNFIYYYYYQICMAVFYSITFTFSCYHLIVSIMEHGYSGVRHVSSIWILIVTYVLIILYGHWQILFNPIVYAYLIMKGRTAYECWYVYRMKYGLQRIAVDEERSRLIGKYGHRHSTWNNIVESIFTCPPESVLHAKPEVFDYESGDTESRSSRVSTSSSSLSFLYKTQNATPVLRPPPTRCEQCLRTVRDCFSCCKRNNIAVVPADQSDRLEIDNISDQLSEISEFEILKASQMRKMQM